MKIKADIDARLVVPVIESCEESLSKISNVKIERGKTYVLNIPFTSMGIGAIINFSGDFKGKIFLDMKSNAAIELTRMFLRENIEKFDKLVIDAVSEILNVIAGNIVNKIHRYGNIEITAPRVITKFSKHIDLKDKNVIIIPLGFNKHIINVSFFIE